MSQRQPVALSVAGSDSSAGAGIQADLKAFSSLGVYGLTVLTLVTAQSTSSVDRVELLAAELVRDQLRTVSTDFRIAAIKSGALGGAEIIRVLAAFLRENPDIPYVLDPVMISKHGHRLIDEQALRALREELLPLALVVTPNLHEAAALANISEISSLDGMYQAGRLILELGCRNVLIKGGHSQNNPADLLLGESGELLISEDRIDSIHTHGTGCTFSAAITASLVQGHPLPQAFRQAKQYITGAIRNAGIFGRGINPVNHFWQADRQFGGISGCRETKSESRRGS